MRSNKRWGESNQRPESPDRGGSIAEALSFTEHLEWQHEIKATSEPFAGSSGGFWTHTTTWSGKVTMQSRDNQSSGRKGRMEGKKEGEKEK